MLVALDANVIVLALTGKPKLRLLARQWLDALEAQDAHIVTSALSQLECSFDRIDWRTLQNWHSSDRSSKASSRFPSRTRA